MCKFQVILAFSSIIAFATVEAFLPSRFSSTLKSPSTALNSFSGDHREDYEYSILNNQKRTCIQHFLSQRSFQSFMYLITEMRDPHTSDWIERFLQAPSLLAYHGTGALNTTIFDEWDSYFLEMAKQPNEKIIIQSRRNSGSKNNNPYLQSERVSTISALLFLSQRILRWNDQATEKRNKATLTFFMSTISIYIYILESSH